PRPAREWRHRTTEPAAKPATSAERPWRQKSSHKTARRHWSRQAKIGIATFAFLLLTAGLIWASFWLLPPKNACLVLVGAGYQENLLTPANVFGWQNLQDLAQLSRDSNTQFLWGSEQLRLQQEPRDFRGGQVWDDNLDNFTEKTVVVYFSLH